MTDKIIAAAGFGVSILLCVILAIAFLRGHGAMLLAGYNTMPEEEQKNWDIKALLRFAGWCLLLFAAFLSVAALGILLELPGLMIAGIILGAFVLLGLVLYVNLSHRFRL